MRVPFRKSDLVSAIATLIALVSPVAYGLWQAPATASASNLGLFSIFMNSPLQLVLPLIAVAVGCSRIYEDLGDRYIANLRTRKRLESYLRGSLLRVALLPFFAFAGATLVVGVIAFVIWPQVGNPYIDPSLYHLDSSSGQTADLASFTFSELMRFGWPTYVLFYAVFVGVACAAFSALGAALLIILDRRVVALLIPWAFYLAETLVAALLDSAHAGLMYAIVPFGLQPVPVLEGAVPVIVLAGLVIALWAFIWRTRFDFSRLR